MAIDTPPAWGKDQLSSYLESAFKNRLATFATRTDRYRKLQGIDACFVRVAEGWLNPPDPISPLLFLRTHAAFRASCEHAMAGQVGDLFAQLRSCLECAGYALLLGKDPGLAEVWLGRHQTPGGIKAVRAAFNPSAIRAALSPLDGRGAEIFDQLYQQTIDFGAHPNKMGVTGNMTMTEAEDRTHIQQVYMHAGGLPLEHGLVATARIGICALETMQHIYGARYELLGVRAAMLDLRRGL